MEECGNRASLGFPALVLPPVERRVIFSVLVFFLMCSTTVTVTLLSLRLLWRTGVSLFGFDLKIFQCLTA